MKFDSTYQRDGLMRVVGLAHTYLTEEMADSGYEDLGTFDYTYDTSSSVETALQTAAMDELDTDRWYTYDDLNRLVTAKYQDVI